MDYNHILLEKEQEDLLAMIVEASRNVPRLNQEKFIVHFTRGGDILFHKGLGGNRRIYRGDIDILSNACLINLSFGSRGSPTFDVTPLGFKYYEYLMKLSGDAVKQVETEIKRYIESDSFKKRFTAAYERWSKAQAQLWSSESDRELTTIGHLCREAMQEFADSLIKSIGLETTHLNKASIVARIRSILEHRASKLASTEKPFLDALLVYWGTVSDLVQRQEHGSEKEKETLEWEDARRICFHTFIVMYEIDRALM